MNALFDFFSPEAGQRRRAALNEFGRDIGYYVPPELRGILGLVAEATPTATIDRASAASMRAADPTRTVSQRIGDVGNMLSEVAGVVAPAAVANRAAMPTAQALQEGLLGFSVGAQDAGRAIVDRLNQPGPVPTMYSNPLFGIGDNGGPRLSSLESVDMPAHSRPEWTGRAPNRTTPFPRYEPKAVPERMDRLLGRVNDPRDPISGLFDAYIDRGRQISGEDWYNTEELRDWFVDSLGEMEGDRQWREFIDLIGATSTGAKVPSNIRMASFYRALDPEQRVQVARLVKDQGLRPADAAAELGIEIPMMPEGFGYGHQKQRNQAGNVINIAEGNWQREVPEGLSGAALTRWLQANPKVKGFANDLLGDDTNIAADMHFMRMLAMADGGTDFLSQQAMLSQENMRALRDIYGDALDQYVSTRMVNGKPLSTVNLKKAAQDGVITDTSAFSSMPTAWADTPAATEYAAYENMANAVAERYGMTPAQFQASLWMGAGEATGLAEESKGSFMQIFRNALDNRANELGISRREMLDMFINNRIPLSALIGAPAAGLLGMSALNQTPQEQN